MKRMFRKFIAVTQNPFWILMFCLALMTMLNQKEVLNRSLAFESLKKVGAVNLMSIDEDGTEYWCIFNPTEHDVHDGYEVTVVLDLPVVEFAPDICP